MVERFVPQRIDDRAGVLRRFVGMTDVTNALDGVPSEEASRRHVFARFDAWIAADAPQGGDVVELRTAEFRRRM